MSPEYYDSCSISENIRLFNYVSNLLMNELVGKYSRYYVYLLDISRA